MNQQNTDDEKTDPGAMSETELRQKDYYNRIAVEYDDHYASEPAMRYRDRLFDRIFEGEQLDGLKTLDAMCGGGQNSTYFYKKGCRMSAIDISESQVEHYKLRFPDAEVICGSSLSTPFPDDHFDLIVTDSMHHLHPRVSEGMQEFFRILKPGGRFVIWEPSAGSVLDLIRKAWYKLDRRYFEDNEESVDVDELHRDHSDQFDLTFKYYGGNLAYVFVVLSMALRISVPAVRFYARPLLFLERLISPLQTKLTSLWVLAEFQKRPSRAGTAPGSS